LLPPKDPSALAEKIRFLLDNPRTAKKMGTAGRLHVMKKFTWDQTAQAYESIYQHATK